MRLAPAPCPAPNTRSPAGVRTVYAAFAPRVPSLSPVARKPPSSAIAPLKSDLRPSRRLWRPPAPVRRAEQKAATIAVVERNVFCWSGPVILSLASCITADAPVQEAAKQWADALCSRRAACGCSRTDCLEIETSRFVEWSGSKQPNAECPEERTLSINQLWTNFAGVNEPCFRPEGSTGPLSCENRLVCDHTTPHYAV